MKRLLWAFGIVLSGYVFFTIIDIIGRLYPNTIDGVRQIPLGDVSALSIVILGTLISAGFCVYKSFFEKDK